MQETTMSGKLTEQNYEDLYGCQSCSHYRKTSNSYVRILYIN